MVRRSIDVAQSGDRLTATKDVRGHRMNRSGTLGGLLPRIQSMRGLLSRILHAIADADLVDGAGYRVGG